jgi:hypothetical protein
MSDKSINGVHYLIDKCLIRFDCIKMTNPIKENNDVLSAILFAIIGDHYRNNKV